MDWDEARPKPKIAIGEDLRTLSVAELEERIGAHEAEIDRIRTELKAKRAQEMAAANLFKR